MLHHMPTRRPRAALVPNANNPRLLIRLLGLVASGLRRPRVLAETLEVELRTVHYYTQAGEWLGLLETSEVLRLTERGLNVAYAPKRQRTRRFADAVWRTPFVVDVMAGRAELPSTEELAGLIQAHDTSLSMSTARRRATAVRALLRPAIPFRPSHRRPRGAQLRLPLQRGAPRVGAGLATARVDTGELPESPDVYARLLLALLDHGELATHHIRAVLDHVGGSELPLGPYVQMALRRGDATRTVGGLTASAGAATRHQVAGDGVLVALTDPDYRTWLEDLLTPTPSPEQIARRRRLAARFRRWDLRLFGEALTPSTVRQSLDDALPGRALSSLPAAGDPGPPLRSDTGSFLSSIAADHLGIALPTTLPTLAGGVRALNPALDRQRIAAASVRLPAATSPRECVHGGLFTPGERLPRAVPDNLSLRLQALQACPALSLLGALCLLARRSGEGLVLKARAERCEVRWNASGRGDLLAVIRAFGTAQGWHVFFPPAGGLRTPELLELAGALGLIHRCRDRIVLAEGIFLTLQEEPEARLVYEGLGDLEDRLAAWFDEQSRPPSR